jgi:hypothetical protein
MAGEDEARRRAEFMIALTTEHFALQSSRGGTISESASRTSLYITTLSSAVVALALVAQLAKATFFIFALAVLPVVFFLGVVTYGRLLQTGVEDTLYARAISRIRHEYAAIDPEQAAYFHETGVDQVGLTAVGLFSLRWQQFLSSAAVIAIVNSVVGGVFIAIVLTSVASAPVWAVALIGAAASMLIAVGFLAHQRRAWMAVVRLMPMRSEL